MSNWSTAIGWSFCFLSFILFLSVYTLISRLKKIDRISRSQDEQGSFNRKICALLATLTMFSSTYMLRFAWDQIVKPDSGEFVAILEGIVVALICDFTPIMILLVFHYRNFTKTTEAPQKIAQHVQRNSQASSKATDVIMSLTLLDSESSDTYA